MVPGLTVQVSSLLKRHADAAASSRECACFYDAAFLLQLVTATRGPGFALLWSGCLHEMVLGLLLQRHASFSAMRPRAFARSPAHGNPDRACLRERGSTEKCLSYCLVRNGSRGFQEACGLRQRTWSTRGGVSQGLGGEEPASLSHPVPWNRDALTEAGGDSLPAVQGADGASKEDRFELGLNSQSQPSTARSLLH